MLIHMRPFLEGSHQATTGAAVVIDVFRAFSLVPWALASGADRVVPVRTEAEALAWRGKANGNLILAGESGGIRLPGFDLGNSPSAIRDDGTGLFSGGGKVMIHRTSAGTQGLLAAVEAGANPVLTGSFVNIGATARYLREVVQPSEVSIVAMGYEGTEAALEDTLCAEYLRSLLLGEEETTPDFYCVKERIRQDSTGQRFFDDNLPQFPEPDFGACIDLDRFDFAVLASHDDTYGISLKAVN